MIYQRENTIKNIERSISRFFIDTSNFIVVITKMKYLNKVKQYFFEHTIVERFIVSRSLRLLSKQDAPTFDSVSKQNHYKFLTVSVS